MSTFKPAARTSRKAKKKEGETIHSALPRTLKVLVLKVGGLWKGKTSVDSHTCQVAGSAWLYEKVKTCNNGKGSVVTSVRN